MTGVRHELNALLVEQLDTLDDLIRQRDSARRWAAEYVRRVDLAERLIEDSFLADTAIGITALEILRGDR